MASVILTSRKIGRVASIKDVRFSSFDRIGKVFLIDNVPAETTFRRLIHLPKGNRKHFAGAYFNGFCPSAFSKDGIHFFTSTSLINSEGNNNRQEVQVQISASSDQQRGPQIEKLCQASQMFLDCHEEMDVPQRSSELLRLTIEWGKLWRKSNNIESLSTENHGDHPNTIFTPDLLQTGVEVVDKLAHILLDMEESAINEACKTQEDRKNILNSDSMRKNCDIIFNIALGGWAMAPPSQMNGVKAGKILSRLEELYDESPEGAKNVRPTTICYGSTIKAWAISVDSAEYNGAIEARNVLENMINVYSSARNTWAKPNLICFNSCLHAYALRGMVEEVEDLLLQMEKCCEEIHERSPKSRPYLCPDVFSYTICVNAYAKSTLEGKKDEAATRADNLLRKMLKRYEKTGDKRCLPNQYTFGSVISLHANSDSFKGAENAERILKWMIDLYEKELSAGGKDYGDHESDNLQPNVEHFLAVLFAYSTRRIRGASEKAQNLLVQMEKMYQAGNDNVKPTYQCFIVCLDILVKSGERNTTVKAEQVLDRLEALYLNDVNSELNNYCYNLVMNAWARSGNKLAFKKAQDILDRMHQVYDETKNEAIRPDKVSYSALMNALINGREQNYAEKSAALLTHMEKEFNNGNKGMKPDTISYATVLKAFGRAGNPEGAEAIIKRMNALSAAGEDVSPNISCYNSLINAYAKSNKKDSSRMVEDVLKRVDQANKKGEKRLQPNIVTYTSCFDALARSGDADRVKRAEALLARIIKTYNSASIWNGLLGVYAKSNMRNKAAKGMEVIERMKKSGVEPELVTYNILLNACSTTLASSEIGRKKALEIAVEVFRILRSEKRYTPNSTTYSTLFWICNKLIEDPEEKKQTIESAFQMCCQDGHVDQMVLHVLRKNTSDSMFWRLIKIPEGRGHIGVDDLPSEWSRNSSGNSLRWVARGRLKHEK